MSLLRRLHHARTFILGVMTLAAAVATPALAQSPESYAPGEVLVAFRPGLQAETKARVALGFGATLAGSRPALGFDKLALPPGASVPDVVAALAADPRVAWAEPNGFYSAATCADCPQDQDLHDLPAAPANQWGIFKTGVPSLWRHGGGGDPGVVIAIVDTGIDDFASPHPDLAANVLGAGHDFVDGDADPTDQGPDRGHGTHVAGIAAAVADAQGIAGVAYCSQLLVVRVLDCNLPHCQGTFADIADGIQWAADHGARVVNLSLGGPSPSSAVRSAVLYALGKKAIVVAASGNDSLNTVSFPGRIPELITVGASNSADQVAVFSNSGPELDLVAPGVSIWSTIPGPAYASWAGTSMATPFVAGVAALLAARNPAITPAEAEAYLKAHTRDLAGTRDGAGRIDFTKLEDWSDAPPAYPTASHGLHLWEWLGRDATAERSTSDPDDADGRPNAGTGHDTDGADDGTFPISFGLLPYLPPHISPVPQFVRSIESVCRHDGPRYGPAPATSLHLDTWFDWNADGSFAAPGEHAVTDHQENPGGWPGNSKPVTKVITPLDEHLNGNPLVVRTRLAYGASAGAPGGAADFGEVEDDVMINFVEDFDQGLYAVDPGVNMTLGAWSVQPDPYPSQPWVSDHGQWHFAVSRHPAGAGSIPCNGAIENQNIMSTPAMDWTEVTEAHLRFWYYHDYDNCSSAPDWCRVEIDTAGVRIPITPVPIGSGTLTFDLSAYIGCPTVQILFVEETDHGGASSVIAIDDVVVWAFDNERPKQITDLALNRSPGTKQLALTWTAPEENLVSATERLANVYSLRYSATPIGGLADWARATPFTPREALAGGGVLPVPAAPATMQSADFTVPSAFQAYWVAAMTDDEVVNASLISNVPADSTLAILGVDVASLGDATAAPGTTATLGFTVTNTGNVDDSYNLAATSSKPWTTTPSADSVTLIPGNQATVSVTVDVPAGAAGQVDSVRLTAVSVTDASVSDSDVALITVTGGTGAVAGAGRMPSVAALVCTGANPFAGEARFELALPAAARGTVAVYDAAGRVVRTLLAGDMAGGRQALRWDGLDDRGRPAASGLYFLEVQTPGFSASERIMRVK